MALAFNETKGKAKKGLVEAYEYTNGDNKVRLFGGVTARYVYWIKGTNNKNFPMECLSFDRDKEAFTNVETDCVAEFYPDLKCSWAYLVLCIDSRDGKIKVLNLKKKLFEQILATAEDLGDPTDPDKGWGVCFKKTKTGPHVFNVEYTLQPLKCKVEPLTEEQKQMIAESPTIDEAVPRATPEGQRKFLLELQAKMSQGGDAMDSNVEEVFDIQ